MTFVNTTSGIPIPQEPMKGKVQIFMKLIETQLESLLTTFSKNTEVTDVNLINIIKKYDTTIVKPITFEKALIIEDDFYKVDYSQIDVEFKKLNI